MAVNSTQTRTRSNTRTGRSPKTPATPAAPVAPARRTRPGQVAPAPLRPVPVAGTRPKPSASAADVVKAYLKAFGAGRYAKLLANLDQLAHAPPLGPKAGAPARDVLPAAVLKAYKQASRRMRRARQAPRGEARDVALHEARKSARRARYAAEGTRPASGKPAKKVGR